LECSLGVAQRTSIEPTNPARIVIPTERADKRTAPDDLFLSESLVSLEESVLVENVEVAVVVPEPVVNVEVVPLNEEAELFETKVLLVTAVERVTETLVALRTPVTAEEPATKVEVVLESFSMVNSSLRAATLGRVVWLSETKVKSN